MSDAEQVLRFEVTRSGERLDKFLSEQRTDLSRSQLQRFIHEGRVLVDGAGAKPSQKLEPGQRVTLAMPAAAPSALAAESIALAIVYADRDIVVVDKPAGMVVHPGHGVRSGTLVNALLARYPELRAFEDSVRPGIVHRLDKDTSGLLVVARHPAAQQFLQEQFAARAVRKTYWALVHGVMHQQHGIIEAAIGRSHAQPTQMAVAGKSERAARTSFSVLERFARFTLVEAHPVTGRTHQIRVHFAALGHPVAGDQTYGRRDDELGLTRQFLHARRLTLTLPSTREPRTFVVDLPADLQAVLDRLREEN